MLTFPGTRVKQFYKENPLWKEKGLRLGQAFHNFMELHKITNPEDKLFCDTLWEASNTIANHMIICRTDWEN